MGQGPPCLCQGTSRVIDEVAIAAYWCGHYNIAKNLDIGACEGDLLAVKTVGAYGFVMSSNYNSRPRAAEVIVDKDNFYLIRKREDYADLTVLEEGLDDQI